MSELGRYEVTGFTSPALDALLDAIRATHRNGGVLFTQVRAVDVDDPGRWFAVGRSIYWDNEVFRSLFDSSAVRGALLKLEIPAPYALAKPPQFYQSPTGTFTLAGELASALVRGGAYISFPGSPAEAMRPGEATVSHIKLSLTNKPRRPFERAATLGPCRCPSLGLVAPRVPRFS
jgi:hypothetical protein